MIGDSFKQNLETRIQEVLGTKQRISRIQQVAGGDINDAFQVELKEGESLFVKTNRIDLFTTEKAALREMRAYSKDSGVVVPTVYGTGFDENFGFFLIMQWIQKLRAESEIVDLQFQFGRCLALFHQAARGEKFGWFQDNYLGRNLQLNSFNEDWVSFFCESRIQWQLQLAIKNGLCKDDPLIEKGFGLIEKIPSILMTDSIPTLIHGDLWSGNYFFGPGGTVVLIDPASYYADAETEFGMISLFGGVTQRFYDGYFGVIPKKSGFEERVQVYRLYHLLNHFNLFGTSYYRECLELINRLL